MSPLSNGKEKKFYELSFREMIDKLIGIPETPDTFEDQVVGGMKKVRDSITSLFTFKWLKPAQAS